MSSAGSFCYGWRLSGWQPGINHCNKISSMKVTRACKVVFYWWIYSNLWFINIDFCFGIQMCFKWRWILSFLQRQWHVKFYQYDTIQCTQWQYVINTSLISERWVERICCAKWLRFFRHGILMANWVATHRHFTYLDHEIC